MTLVLHGPSFNPALPRITPEALAASINAELGGQINVKGHPFGATGDGATDDATALSAALAAVAAGGELVFPAGTYKIGSALSQALTGSVSIKGAGSGATILIFSNDTDGLMLTLATATTNNVHVSGLTIKRATSGTYTHTGLSITCANPNAFRQGLTTISDVEMVGVWLTGIDICMSICSLDHVVVGMANATGSGPGNGIHVAGIDASNYTTSVTLNDVSTVGGQNGFLIGSWVQGVFVSNSNFIGNDYGIQWAGVSGHADLLLAISNTHFNSGTRGVLTFNGLSPQIVNTYSLHFGIPAIGDVYAAFEFHNIAPGMISSSSMYGSGSSSTSTQEYAVILNGGFNVDVLGNYIEGHKNAGIYVNATHNTLVAGNIASLPMGIPLVQYASVDISNQAYGNQLNGVPDMNVDGAGLGLPVGLHIGAGATTIDAAGNMFLSTSLQVGANGATPFFTINGAAASNRFTQFKTAGVSRWFMGANGTAESGSDAGSDFDIISAHDDGSLIANILRIKRSTGKITVAHPLTYSGPFIDAVNDASAASAGVGVGEEYRNGSVKMVRVGTSTATAPVVNVLDFGVIGNGTANDTSAIQAVLDTYAGKAVVFIPDTGHPYLCHLQLPSGTDLLIHGTLKLPNGANNNVINMTNVNDITIRGHGVIDGNGAGQTTYGAGIASVNASNVRILDVTIQNALFWNLNITTGSTNVRVDRVKLLNGVASNEFAVGCDNCWITNSYIDGPPTDGGFSFYGGVTNSGIIGCEVTNGFSDGIGVYSDVAQPAPCSNIIISNNIVHDCVTGGIAVGTDGSGAVTGVVQTGIVISGNRCYNNGSLLNNQYADIWIDHGTSVTVTGNNLSGSGSAAGSALFFAGVFVGVYSSHVNITDNTIWNEGNSGSGTGCGVYIQAANDVLVQGNQFYDNQITHTMTYGIDGSFGARNAVINNVFGTLGANAILGPVHPTPASDTVIAGPTLGGPGNALVVRGLGISYNQGHAISLDWSGIGPTLRVDGTSEGSLVFSINNIIELEWSSLVLSVIVDGTDQGSLVHSTNAHQVTVTWAGAPALALSVDGTPEGIILTDAYMASRPNAANDAAAAALGVAVDHAYLNGSVMMIRKV